MTSCTGPAVLDLHILTGMYGDNSAVTICQVLSSFRAEANSYIDYLQQALQTQDYPEVARLSHSLKSMCGLVGACQLMTLCQRTELAARQGDKVALDDCQQELAIVWRTLMLQLHHTLQEHGHANV
ncbi:Hpt domain-containing protein [Arsukibacterium sp.]|uniref:Hpt domain-containing protein n=1 Tax=Arsukibacterium sp. TaxID=1977258 RepID=UPI001BD471EE|nr:Hpt domain-containing protein [Arsukibacterium sp.]